MHNGKKPVISIILTESALEPIMFLTPKEQKELQKKGNKPIDKTLLDISIHNHLMQDLEDKNKRGRPDIIHQALLLALGTRLNKEGYLKIYVHTRNDEIIVFNSGVRIPRNYNRFVGLMEQLFEVKIIPPNAKETLISISSQSLEDLLKTLAPNMIILFSEKGTPTNNNYLQKAYSENQKIVILIGGFPHGDFSQRILDFADLKLSIYPKSLDTAVVLAYVIHSIEQYVIRK